MRFIYIDKESGIAVIAQAYMKKNPTLGTASPSNKASDLNTAAAWLFTRSKSGIPSEIMDKASELRDEIKEGNINQIW